MKAITNIRLSKRQKQWAWFIGLWCVSLFAVLMLGYTIKFFMSLI